MKVDRLKNPIQNTQLKGSESGNSKITNNDPTRQVNNPQELAQNLPSDQPSPYTNDTPAKNNTAN